MPALSPDGKLLVYVSDSAGEGVLDLWVKQVAGGRPVRLVSGIGSVSNPQFSPDATSVYFLGPQNEIFEVSTLGGPARKLIDSAGLFGVSAHGDIAFAQPSTGGGPAPMLMMPPGGTPSRWRPECATAVPPAWSPEGKQVAFMGICNNQRGLFLSSHDGSSLRRIAGETLLPGFGREGPGVWSQIFWYRLSGGREGLVVSWRHGDTVNLTRISLDGTMQPITQGTGWESWPSVSAAGQIAFTGRRLHRPSGACHWRLRRGTNAPAKKLLRPPLLLSCAMGHDWCLAACSARTREKWYPVIPSPALRQFWPLTTTSIRSALFGSR